MAEIKDIISDMAASLWIMPASENELLSRDFLKGKSKEMCRMLLYDAERKGLIYEFGTMFCCYKSTAKELNKKGYNLDLERNFTTNNQ